MERNFSVVFVSAVLALALSACGGGGESLSSGVQSDDQSSPVNSSGNQAGSNGATFGLDVPAFKDILLVYRWQYLLTGPWLDQDAMIRFNDGTATFKLGSFIETGTSGNAGTQWRGDPSSNDLALGRSSSDSYKKVEASIASDPIRPNEVLDGCYKSTGFIAIPTSDLGAGPGTSLSYNTFCFQTDGLFSNDSSRTTVTSSLIASGGANDAGYYEIDGHIIRLTYGDGTVRDALFAIYSLSSEPRFGISMDGTIFTK